MLREQHDAMSAEFAALMTHRRDMDVDLGAARRNISVMSAAMHELGNAPLTSVADETVALLACEVDCQRRCLDALSRLDDEKALVLQRQRDECDVRLRRFLGSRAVGCGELGDAVDELRMAEQRIRDLEDALLADSAASLARQQATAAERRQAEEEERHLRGAVRDAEEAVTALDAQLRALSEQDAAFHEKQQAEEKSSHHNNTELALRRSALKAKVDRRSAVVQKLSAAVDSIGGAHNSNNFGSPQQRVGGVASPTGGRGASSFEEGEDALASSIRSPANLRRILALVKSTACHLREDFAEISSAISHYNVELAELRSSSAGSGAAAGGKKAKSKQVAEYAREELNRLLCEIGRLSTSVLEEHYNDEQNGVSIHALLAAVRRFCVFADVVEAIVGPTVMIQQLRLADDFSLLPQLYGITAAAVEAKAEMRRGTL